MQARFTITIDGDDYIVEPGSFKEGAVRRQASFQEFDGDSLKSNPESREFLQTSWIGGSQWEQPRYTTKPNTYFDGQNISATDRAGALQPATDFSYADSNLTRPSAPLIAYSRNGVGGAVSIDGSTADRFYEWNGTAFVSGSNNFPSQYGYMAGTASTGDLVYALTDTGTLLWWNTTGSTEGDVATGLTIYSGAAMWADDEWVWIYNGDRVYRLDIDDSYNVEEATGVVNDGFGPDVFATDADFTGAPLIPKFSTPRAMSTSEGIFYVKNVYEAGLPVAKIFRIDRDASGSYILTPTATLPKGTVAMSIAHHLGSLVVSTVSNFYTALDNTDDQRVILYHVTGGSVGAIGSPLGGNDIDETPVWLLGSVDEQLYIGGRLRIWQYDARVGAIHPIRYNNASKYADYGGGWWQMATVSRSAGSGRLFMHCSGNGLSAAPYLLIEEHGLFGNTNGQSNYIESNWFDFGLPAEVKSIEEVFYDFDNIRSGESVTIEVAADNGAYQTVATASTTYPNRVASAANPAGYRFKYRVTFTDDSSATPVTSMLALGFTASSGEMVEFIQCTINGEESVNVENNVQVPGDVYDQMTALRINATPVTVSHSYSQYEYEANSGEYKVVSVTARKDSPAEGLYDIVLMKPIASGRIATA